MNVNSWGIRLYFYMLFILPTTLYLVFVSRRKQRPLFVYVCSKLRQMDVYRGKSSLWSTYKRFLVKYLRDFPQSFCLESLLPGSISS